MAHLSILLQNGTVLFHEKDDHVTSLRDTDVLIEGNIIKKIAPSITGDAGTKTIDCSGKIISPGFIDTHHHVWQTQLKGRFSDDTLFDYMPKGRLLSAVTTFAKLTNSRKATCKASATHPMTSSGASLLALWKQSMPEQHSWWIMPI